jgi:N-acetylmuramoyl-L-alanine amidase
MTDPEVLAALAERDLLGLTLWGEARGESLDGRAAVAHVITNRVAAGAYGGPSLRAVVLAPKQFSCWWPYGGLSNHAALMTLARCLAVGPSKLPPILRECQWVAEGVLSGAIRDASQGADHYVAKWLYQRDEGRSWWRRLRVTAQIGEHVFLSADGRGPEGKRL